MHIRRLTGFAAPVAIAIAMASAASAWGAQGHHIVARVAWALMTPEARARATALLGGGQEAFVASATWADDIRPDRPETFNWHFADIPADPSARYDASRDCKPTDKGDCIIAEMARARAELADPQRPPALKAESLKYLIHFVGDIHQPLHAVDDHDHGGNLVRVTPLREGGRATNLHAAWDTGIINLSDETEAAHAARLLNALKAYPVDTSLDPVKWVNESHALAMTVAYHYPEFSTTGPPSEPITLDDTYLEQAKVTIDAQLMAAGARLAALLNAILK